MHTLESLKKKIETAQDLLAVVKTMKSLAAVNIRQFEGAALSLEEYNRIVELGWQALFRSRTGISRVRTNNQMIHLVLGSDQGMCGQFNELLLELVFHRENQLKARGVEILFWTVGERAKTGLEDVGRESRAHFDLPGSMPAITTEVQRLVQSFESWQREGGVETFCVFYNQLVKGGNYQPVYAQILPLDETWLEKYQGKKWSGRCLPRLGLPWQTLFRHLFRQYLFVSLYRAFAQSLASENAARLRSMQAAEKNIRELTDELQRKFRETRQSVITAELLDIIAGFEAISKEPA